MLLRRNLIILGLLAASVLAAGTAGCNRSTAPTVLVTPSAAPSGDLLSDVRQRGTLIIVTDPNYSPQSKRDADGSWHGFDVAVGRQIARRLGVRPVFEPADFGLVVRGNWLGKWDINVGSMSITSQRAKALWFTRSYYSVPGAIAVSSSSGIQGVDDLAGKRIGVADATTFQAFLAGRLGKNRFVSMHVQAVPYDTDVHALRDLTASNPRSIWAVLTSLPTIRSAMSAGIPLRTIDGTVYRDDSAIALDRSSFRSPLRLLWAVDDIVAAMRRDGTLKRLSIQYYAMDLTKR